MRGVILDEVQNSSNVQVRVWWKAEFETALSELHEQGVLDVIVWEPWGHREP